MAKQNAKHQLSEAERISERIKQARTAQELTQSGLADKAGLSRSAVVHYEQGNAVPGGLELVKLAQALGLTPNFLLSGSDSFFNSQTVEHALADDSMEIVLPRMAMCLMALDREVRESFSALLMNLVKAKFTKRQYQDFIASMGMVNQFIPEMIPGIEKMADKALVPKRAPASKAKGKAR
jgi:transcriptional regulator with XRE-family HTH domain